jgi:hypothetical protein
MDDGLLRREPSRAAAVTWATSLTGDRVLERHTYGPGRYEYVIGLPGEDHTECWFIEREDVATADGGWNVGQEPLYPNVDQPFERVARKEI